MHHMNGNGNGAALASAIRNRYYYGKLLDVPHLEMEQSYFLERRRMLNRLAVGFGVLCGLDVRADGDAVVVAPGVAIDGRGREIVVDAPRRVDDPFALTDECGRPTGDQADAGGVMLCLDYHECEVDPAPVLVADCEVREECVPGAVSERYKLLLRPPGDACVPAGIDKERCAAIFGAKDDLGVGLRGRLCQVLSGPCTEPNDCCVPLALIGKDGAGATTVDPCAVRTTIYSNAELLDLILCLAERVEECCAGGGPTPTTHPPVVEKLLPTPGDTVNAKELSDRLGSATGVLAVTFDRKMSDERLKQPAPWLRMWLVSPPNADGVSIVQRIPIELDRIENVTAVYDWTGDGASTAENLRIVTEGQDIQSARALVQMRAEDDSVQIVDQSAPPILLDADFTATGISAGTLEKLWSEKKAKTQVRNLWDQFPPGPAADSLPSGDGTAGGRLNSYFEVTL
jgi:hypothetical protein